MAGRPQGEGRDQSPSRAPTPIDLTVGSVCLGRPLGSLAVPVSSVDEGPAETKGRVQHRERREPAARSAGGLFVSPQDDACSTTYFIMKDILTLGRREPAKRVASRGGVLRIHQCTSMMPCVASVGQSEKIVMPFCQSGLRKSQD